MADLQGNTLAITGAATVGGTLTTPVVVSTRTVLPYSTVIATDASQASIFSITVTDGVAFTISAPLKPTTGQEITYTIRNTSGGAMGAITWNAVFKLAAFTNPATATNRSITYVYDGTNWVELNRAGADVPN